MFPYIHLRGAAVPGVNTYLPLRTYREGEHMTFRVCGAWS